jgi:hypothetical protein
MSPKPFIAVVPGPIFLHMGRSRSYLPSIYLLLKPHEMISKMSKKILIEGEQIFVTLTSEGNNRLNYNRYHVTKRRISNAIFGDISFFRQRVDRRDRK